MAENRVYRLKADGNDFSEFGPYESEEKLLEVLRELNRSARIDWSSLRIHVYETDATDLGIGRTYLGSMGASAVLMAGEVNEERLTA